MYQKYFFIFYLLIIVTFHVSCQSHPNSQIPNQNWKDMFLMQITQLQETKSEQVRIDSLKKILQIPVSFSIEIIDSSFFENDKGKNISLAFLNEQSPYDSRITYTIKFDKSVKKIISIEKNKMVQSNVAKPPDEPIITPNANLQNISSKK